MENNEQPVAPELAAQVQELVNLAFTDGPEKAIAQARATGNDHLVDELQGALSRPDIHDELIKRGQIAPAA